MGPWECEDCPFESTDDEEAFAHTNVTGHTVGRNVNYAEEQAQEHAAAD